jgi:hypothetical protein
MADDLSAQSRPRRSLFTVCACVFLVVAFAVTAIAVPYAWPWRLALFVVLAAGYWVFFPKCRFARTASSER